MCAVHVNNATSCCSLEAPWLSASMLGGTDHSTMEGVSKLWGREALVVAGEEAEVARLGGW